jgi:tryptophan-rich sensory protein
MSGARPTIFALAAAAGVLGWRGEAKPEGRQWMVGLFAANGFLNILWTLMFFKVRRPDLALVEVGGLWLSILALIIFLYRRSALASALLVPYLAWVTIASALNYEVVALNGPFS